MRRETRINLIVLVVILVLVAPGGVRLFMKKLQPGANTMDFREPVRTSLVYMDPIKSPPQIRRTIPRGVAEWIATRNRAVIDVGGGMRLVEAGTERRPILSESRRLQLVQWRDDPQGSTRLLYLLLWESIPGDDVTLRGDRDGATIQRQQRTPLPAPIRKELRDAGYVQPPLEVLEIAAQVPADTRSLTLALPGGREETLSLP